MTAPHGSTPDRFDRAVRRLHDDALEQLSPRTLARLRPRDATPLTPAWPGRRPTWALATACAVVFAAVLGMQFLPEAEAPPAAVVAAPQALPVPQVNDPLATLEEDPDMFLWLASIEAQPVAME